MRNKVWQGLGSLIAILCTVIVILSLVWVLQQLVKAIT